MVKVMVGLRVENEIACRVDAINVSAAPSNPAGIVCIVWKVSAAISCYRKRSIYFGGPETSVV